MTDWRRLPRPGKPVQTDIKDCTSTNAI